MQLIFSDLIAHASLKKVSLKHLKDILFLRTTSIIATSTINRISSIETQYKKYKEINALAELNDRYNQFLPDGTVRSLQDTVDCGIPSSPPKT